MEKKTFKATLAVALCFIMLVGTVAVGGTGFAEVLDALALRASADNSTYSVGDTITFGSYPQSKVTDEDTITALNALAGDNSTWTSYGCYSGTGTQDDGLMTASDYMRYTDVTYNEEKYRAVVFDSYIPLYTGFVSTTSAAETSMQAFSGYTSGNVYWFKYEPIEWRVLDPGTGLVMAETILDSKAFNNYLLSADGEYYGDAGKTYYADNYAESSIREWLNDDFYNTAFSADQQANIETTTLDNSAYDTDHSAYDSASTSDKVYMLSYSDVLNSSYGFATSADTSDTARLLKGTDYADAQNLYPYLLSDNACCYWRLRTAGNGSNYACYIDDSGCVLVDGLATTDITPGGIAPVMNLQTLKSDTYTVTYMFDGSEYTTQTYAYGDTITPPEEPVVGESYKFGGWSGLPETMPAKDITVTGTIVSGYEVGDIIEYGTYPQTEVTDEDTITALNAIAGDNSTWTSYGYYTNTDIENLLVGSTYIVSDYMRYKDVSYNGEKYRAVTFDTYRPAAPGIPSTTDLEPLSTAGTGAVLGGYQNQQDNGYTCGNVYWFKYEPLRWRVLDPETGLVMCDSVIDSRQFKKLEVVDTENLKDIGTPWGGVAHWISLYYGDAEMTYYLNNYAESDIREWLNDDFYNTAFSSAGKTNIFTTTLDNSAYSTEYSEFASASTSDKIYLLSYSDILNSSYGFATSAETIDTARQLYGTDYAKAQGLQVLSGFEDEYASANGSSVFYLRTAGNETFYTCSSIAGGITDETHDNRTCYGVVPAMNLELLKNDTTGSELATDYSVEIITDGNGDVTNTDGDTIVTTTVTVGDSVTVIAVPEEGSHFIGWYDDDVLVSGDTEYTFIPDEDTNLIAKFEVHTKGTTVSETAPTCTGDGSGTYTCAVCSGEYTVQLPATGHTVVTDEAVARTVTTDGLTEGSHCSVCNEVFVAQKKTPAIFSVCEVSKDRVLRGDTVTWTFVTAADVTNVKVAATYTGNNGITRKLVSIYKTTGTNVTYVPDEEAGTATWTVTAKMYYSTSDDSVDETIAVSYKLEGDNTWYLRDENTMTITICDNEAVLNPAAVTYAPYTLIDVTAPETAATGTRGTVTIRTTTDCSKVRIGLGSKYATFQTTSANCTCSDADGIRTWTINYKFASAGANTYSVSTRGSAWSEAKTFTTTVA